MVKLRRRLVIPSAPGLAAVKADGGSLVCSENHACRVFRIDPKLVIIIPARCSAQHRDRLSSVLRSVKSNIRHVENFRVVWIDRDAIEIPRPAGKRRSGVGEDPSVASIVRAIKARSSVLGQSLELRLQNDERIDALAVRRNINPYAPPIALWQPVSVDTSPRLAGILRAVKAAAGSIDRSIGSSASPFGPLTPSGSFIFVQCSAPSTDL